MLTLGSYFAQNAAPASTLHRKQPKAQPKHYHAQIASINRRRIRRNRRMVASQPIRRRNHKHQRIRHPSNPMAGNRATRHSNPSNRMLGNRRRIRHSNHISNPVMATRRRLLGANPKAQCR